MITISTNDLYTALILALSALIFYAIGFRMGLHSSMNRIAESAAKDSLNYMMEKHKDKIERM